ncbi:MAG: hypothetical protein ABJD97_11740 [Betaproteobacteria bacterium]
MGKSTTWIAIASKTKDAALAELALADTGQEVAPGACAMAVATQPDGTIVIVLDQFEHPMAHDDSLVNLSGGAAVVACSELDSANASRSAAYRDATPLWRVSHVLDRGTHDLQTEGKPPATLKALRTKARAAHARDGHDAAMGIPAALAQDAAGVDADAFAGLGFTRLEETSPEPFASPTARWQRIRRVQGGDEFDRLVPDQGKKIVAALEQPLAILGFDSVALPEPKKSDFNKPLASFTRVRGEFNQAITIFAVGSGTFDVSFTTRHDGIDQLVDKWITQLGPVREAAPWIFHLRPLEGDVSPFYDLRSAADFTSLLALLQARVPAWPDRLLDFGVLDGLMQPTYASRPLIEHGLKRRASLLAGACLAGYPDIAGMLASSTHTEMVMKQYTGLLDELRASTT